MCQEGPRSLVGHHTTLALRNLRTPNSSQQGVVEVAVRWPASSDIVIIGGQPRFMGTS